MIEKFFKILIICITLSFVASIAMAQSHSQKCNKAEKFYERALRIKAGREDRLAFGEKQKLYQKVIKDCPTHYKAYNSLGDIYAQLGIEAEAIRHYKKAIKLNNQYYLPYAGLGDIYFNKNSFQEAIRYYNFAIDLNPNDELSKDFRRQAEAIDQKCVVEERIIKELLEQMQLSEVRLGRNPVKPRISFSERLIPFDVGKIEIREDAKRQLNELGKALRSVALDRSILEISAYTDTESSERDNLSISLKRAEAVKDYLVKHFKLPATQFSPKGCGSRSYYTVAASAPRNSRIEVALVAQTNSHK